MGYLVSSGSSIIDIQWQANYCKIYIAMSMYIRQYSRPLVHYLKINAQFAYTDNCFIINSTQIRKKILRQLNHLQIFPNCTSKQLKCISNSTSVYL